MAQGVGVLTGISLGPLSPDAWASYEAGAYLEQSRHDAFGFGARQTDGETLSPN